MVARVWDAFLTEQDQAVFASTKYGKRGGFGTRPALFIIDVQYRFCGDRAMPILDAVQHYPTACGEVSWQAVPHIERLMHLCRDRNIPIIYTVGERRIDLGDSGLQITKSQREPEKNVLAGAHATSVVEPLSPQLGDIMISKRKPSAFFGTPLVSYLNVLDIDTLIVTGCTTSGCIRATVVDGYALNYKVVVPEECTFDRFQASHALSLFDLNCKYADVISTNDVADWLVSVEPRNTRHDV